MLFHDAAGLTAAWENCNAGCNKMAGSAFGMLFDVTPPTLPVGRDGHTCPSRNTQWRCQPHRALRDLNAFNDAEITCAGGQPMECA